MTTDTVQTERTRIGWHPITLALVLVLGLCLLRAGAILLMRRLWGAVDFEPSPRGVLFLLAVFLVGSVGLIGGGLFGLAGVSWERLGWRRVRLAREILRGFLGAMALGAILVPFALVSVSVLGLKPPTGAAQPTLSLLGVAMSVFFGFFIASWMEENLFRGYLQPLLIERWGLWRAILAQAALFSAAHIGYAQAWPFFLLYFLTGVILGWLRGRNGSLVAPFIAHGLIG